MGHFLKLLRQERQKYEVLREEKNDAEMEEGWLSHVGLFSWLYYPLIIQLFHSIPLLLSSF